jgi:hypothetical protein
MVTLISATFSQHLLRGAVLTLPMILLTTGFLGCANPVPYSLPSDGFGGDPSSMAGGATDLGGAPPAGGDTSVAGSFSTGGDPSSSAGASSGGGASGGSPSFGGATSSAGGAGAPAGGSNGKAGASGGGATGSAGAAGTASAGTSSGGATGGGTCAAAFVKTSCLNLTVGSKVSAGGHNWTCNNDNCRNCDNTPTCEPSELACPWGMVWTDNGSCN